jgi:hypothetical protein
MTRAFISWKSDGFYQEQESGAGIRSQESGIRNQESEGIRVKWNQEPLLVPGSWFLTPDP